MEYAENFEGLGCLGPLVHFKTKQDVTPVQMPIHRIPVAKRAAEKGALDKYEKAGIITKVVELHGVQMKSSEKLIERSEFVSTPVRPLTRPSIDPFTKCQPSTSSFID